LAQRQKTYKIKKLTNNEVSFVEFSEAVDVSALWLVRLT